MLTAPSLEVHTASALPAGLRWDPAVMSLTVAPSSSSWHLPSCDLEPRGGGSEVLQEPALVLLASCCLHIHSFPLDLSWNKYTHKMWEFGDDWMLIQWMPLDFKCENWTQGRAVTCPNVHYWISTLLIQYCLYNNITLAVIQFLKSYLLI